MVGTYRPGHPRIPIVPVSLVGSSQHHRTGHWMLWPARITIYLHDTIETKGLTKEDVRALRERVRAIIAAPVEGASKQGQEILPSENKRTQQPVP